MSASTAVPRARGRVQHASQPAKPSRQLRPSKKSRKQRSSDSNLGPRESFIGVDFSKLAIAPRSRTWLPLLVVALAVALGIAALRIDLIRTRYALMDTMQKEQALIEAQRALIVEKLTLRDPSALSALAEKRGYRPAEIIRTLIDPMPMDANPARGLPNVASGPPMITPLRTAETP